MREGYSLHGRPCQMLLRGRSIFAIQLSHSNSTPPRFPRAEDLMEILDADGVEDASITRAPVPGEPVVYGLDRSLALRLHELRGTAGPGPSTRSPGGG